MRLGEFLNTTNVEWYQLRLWEDMEAYADAESGELETYTDMRDIPDEILERSIDNWDMGFILSNNSGLTDMKIILDVLI